MTLTGLPASTTYGVGAQVTVIVESDGLPVNGPVELRRGSTVLASGVASDGKVTLTVPGVRWAIGANLVRAAFLGSGIQPPASTHGQAVAVAKATSKVIVDRFPTSISRTKSARMRVKITVRGVAAPTGSFFVYDGSKRIAGYRIGASWRGVRTVWLPKITKRGTHKIRVRFGGSVNIKASYSVYYSLKVY